MIFYIIIALIASAALIAALIFHIRDARFEPIRDEDNRFICGED